MVKISSSIRKLGSPERIFVTRLYSRSIINLKEKVREHCPYFLEICAVTNNNNEVMPHIYTIAILKHSTKAEKQFMPPDWGVKRLWHKTYDDRHTRTWTQVFKAYEWFDVFIESRKYEFGNR